MGLVTVLLVTCMASLGSSNHISQKVESKAFDVLHYGAVGDGKHDDSKAFLDAWEAACESGTGATSVTIPGERTYLLNPLKFKGPCKSSSINVQVSGRLIAPLLKAWPDKNTHKWIVFSQVEGLIVNGNGAIDGRGSNWWSKYKALSFENCNNLELHNLRHIDSPRNHISIYGCTGVTISNLEIIAPEDSPNTDGINLSHSSIVKVQDCNIGTGDDCVAINGGTANIEINNVACGPGHGISIGSLGEAGSTDTVEEVHVSNCIFSRTMYGARIKTWQGGSGYARSISFKDIAFIEAKHPIIINQYYCDSHSSAPCKNQTKAVKISDVTFDGVHGTSATDDAIQLSCSQTYGCQDLVLNNVDIKPIKQGKSVSSSCINAQGISTNIKPAVSCLLSADSSEGGGCHNGKNCGGGGSAVSGCNRRSSTVTTIEVFFHLISFLFLFKPVV